MTKHDIERVYQKLALMHAIKLALLYYTICTKDVVILILVTQENKLGNKCLGFKVTHSSQAFLSLKYNYSREMASNIHVTIFINGDSFWFI